MSKILAIVAAFLLFQPIGATVAMAAEYPEHLSKNVDATLKQKKAEKILLMLKAIGISDPDIREFAYKVEERTKDGYLMLHQEEVIGGKLSFRYKLKPNVSVRQLELQYVPDDSNFEYTARTNSVMMNYKFNF